MATEPMPDSADMSTTTISPPLSIHWPRGFPHPLQRVSRFFRILGPGLITGAADDDPSGIGTYSQTGAAFGAGQLWLALYMLPMAIAVQEMCGRVGLVTGKGIAGVVRQHYSRPILFGAVALLLIANTINIGADLGAMAASVSLLVPGLPTPAVLLGFALLILGLEIFIPYRQYARVLKFLTLSLLAYVITAIITQPNWGELLRASVVPTIQLTPAFLALVIAVLGTTISPYLFFWQASEEVEEIENNRYHRSGKDGQRQHVALHKQISVLRIDTALGMIASLATFWFIVTATGTTLHTHGITNITSADQAALALTPLVHAFPNAGILTRVIFALGVIGTGLLAVPVLAGSAAYGVAEALHWREGLSKTFSQARGFYGVIAAATLVGVLINFLGVNPITALIYAAVINGIIAVPLLVLILLVANNKSIMGGHGNGKLSNIVGIATTVAMGIAAIVTIVSLWWH